MRPAQDDRTATVQWRRRDPSAIEVISSAACGLGRGTCFAWKTFFRHCDAGKRLIIAKPYQRYGRDDNQGPSSTRCGRSTHHSRRVAFRMDCGHSPAELADRSSVCAAAGPTKAVGRYETL